MSWKAVLVSFDRLTPSNISQKHQCSLPKEQTVKPENAFERTAFEP